MDNVEMKREKPKIPCRYCENTFSSKNAKRRHIGKMHKNRNHLNEGLRESLPTQQAEPTSQDAEAEIVKENLCREEKEAGMACLSRPCSPTSRIVDISTAELKMEDLTVLDMMQLQDLCVKRTLVSSGNRTTVIDRLLNRFIIHDQHSTRLISKILNIDSEYVFTYSIFTYSIFTQFFAVLVQQARGHSKLIKVQIAQTQQQPPI